jgi:hypothetical protein
MRMRKGQTAMEYLMTYGWAILIIMVVLGVLYYLGVLNPSQLTPSQCAFPPGFSCTTYKLKSSSGNLSLQVGQGTGKTVIVTGVFCSANMSSSYSPGALTGKAVLYDSNENVTITSGASAYIAGDDKTGDTGKSIAVTCYDANEQLPSPSLTSVGSIYIGRLYVNYTEVQTGMERITVASLTARYEV